MLLQWDEPVPGVLSRRSPYRRLAQNEVAAVMGFRALNLPPPPPDPPVDHPPRHCDKKLRAFDGYDRHKCEPARFTCTCGRIWVHICDEAEGCFYVLEEKE